MLVGELQPDFHEELAVVAVEVAHRRDAAAELVALRRIRIEAGERERWAAIAPHRAAPDRIIARVEGARTQREQDEDALHRDASRVAPGGRVASGPIRIDHPAASSGPPASSVPCER